SLPICRTRERSSTLPLRHTRRAPTGPFVYGGEGGIHAGRPWPAPLRGGSGALRRANRQSLPICRTRERSSTLPLRHTRRAPTGPFVYGGEGGIRTLEGPLISPYSLSRGALST